MTVVDALNGIAVDPLLEYRKRFPILERTNYLVSHSLGAIPHAAREDLNEFAEVWATRGVRAWGDRWWMLSSEVGDVIAPIIGAPQSSVIMQTNVTTAHALVLTSFEYVAPRNRIVMVEGEFPSTRYLYDGLARRLGAEIVTVPANPSSPGVILDDLLRAIDERTMLVPVSHVLFESSFIVDAAAVARRCREVGATLILDVFQSAGVLPVDVTGWDVPIALGGVLKWLCGGPGGAFLYVEPTLRDSLEPSFTGWMAHETPFAFEPPPMKFRSDVLRFGIGTPPIASLYAAMAGPRIVREAGVAAIREKSLRLTARLIELADARGFEVRTPRSAFLRGGSVSLAVPHAREVSMELNARDVVCDFRPKSGVRFSPHFYTETSEVDAAMEAIDGILARGSWVRHEPTARIVT